MFRILTAAVCGTIAEDCTASVWRDAMLVRTTLVVLRLIALILQVEAAALVLSEISTVAGRHILASVDGLLASRLVGTVREKVIFVDAFVCSVRAADPQSEVESTTHFEDREGWIDGTLCCRVLVERKSRET